MLKISLHTLYIHYILKHLEGLKVLATATNKVVSTLSFRVTMLLYLARLVWSGLTTAKQIMPAVAPSTAFAFLFLNNLFTTSVQVGSSVITSTTCLAGEPLNEISTIKAISTVNENTTAPATRTLKPSLHHRGFHGLRLIIAVFGTPPVMSFKTTPFSLF